MLSRLGSLVVVCLFALVDVEAAGIGFRAVVWYGNKATETGGRDGTTETGAQTVEMSERQGQRRG